jgi:MFS family permease
MTALVTGTPDWSARTRFYPGWIQVWVAAFAMVCTFPGRTQGLGLITEPLLADLHLDAVLYARLNLWATLLGSLAAPAAGWLLDRFGARSLLVVIGAGLGAVVIAMSQVRGIPALAACLVLTRGLGQSALSAASIALVGQWFRQRLARAMAVYSILLSVGFMMAFPLIEMVVRSSGWRTAWWSVGCGVLALAPVAGVLARRSADASGLEDGEPAGLRPPREPEGATLGEALRTPGFWIVGLSSALYLLVASGISLFNERILAELGFDRRLYVGTLIVTALTALAGNFLGGALAARGSVRALLSSAMGLLALGLVVLPHLRSETAVYAQAVLMGLAGGFVTVIFFAYWSRQFGRKNLGRIQGVAQAMTVVGSAVGPLLLAQCHAAFGSHALVFRVLAAAVAVMALVACCLPGTRPDPAR